MKLPNGPPMTQPEMRPKVAAATATSMAALAPSSTAMGANEAALPWPPVMGMLPVIRAMRGGTLSSEPTPRAKMFCKMAQAAASMAKMTTSLPPFLRRARLAEAPLAAKNKQ